MARTKTDKIFDNSFEQNEGFEENSGKPTFTISSQFERKTFDSAEEEIHFNMLFDEVDKLIRESKYQKLNEIKEDGKIAKLNKIQINEIYSLVVRTIGNKFNRIEIFSTVSDYFDIFPTKFYNSLSNTYKEALIMELDSRMNILEKKKIKKLF